jgi:hypothetical protein
MEEPISYESTQEPLDDEERELMNPDNWNWEHPIEAIVHENLGIIMPIEVTFEEYGRLDAVARSQGLTPHEFMKRTALEAALAIRS